jgi:prepilin-type processing-associated H-X9-DG protein
VCKSNLRQIYQAGLMFATDHHGFMQFAGKANGANSAAPADIGDPSETDYTYYDDTAGRRPVPFPVALAPYLGSKIRLDSAADMVSDFENPSCTARRIFTCPAQAEGITPGTTVSDEAGWYGPRLSISYAYNEGVLGYEQNSDRRFRGQYARAHPATDIFFMTDAVPRSETQGSEYIAWFPPDTGRYTLADIYDEGDGGLLYTQFDFPRHHSRINVAYFDGHVDTLIMDEDDLQHAVVLPE